MENATRKIIIVGGGSSGWITANLLAKKLGGGNSKGVEITLIESPEIQPVAVGEGTFPTMRQTLKTLGVLKQHLYGSAMQHSNKRSSLLIGWTSPKMASTQVSIICLTTPENFLILTCRLIGC